jgi:RND family efflux transporter MFP subunit
MKKIHIIILTAIALVITACGGSGSPTALPTVALDTNAAGPGSSASVSSGGVIASAEVRPVDSVNLSFSLLGMVTTVDVKVGDEVTAGQAVATLDTVILEARVAEAQANVAAADAQYALLKRVGGSQDQLDSAQADIDRAKAILEQTKATLAQATLYAPIGGTVVKVDIAPGETASPGQIIIVVADLSQLRIETTDLSERDIPAVEIGQTANVLFDALDESFTGKVVDIDRQSETVGGDVTYRVMIELDTQPAGLRWGMSAEVEIQTEQ